MTAWQGLTRTWNWEPSVLLGCGGLAVGYAAALRRRFTGAALYFAAGLLVLLLALTSPLDALGDTYLFSAHMLQHLLLLMVVPPLLLLGSAGPLATLLLAWSLGIGTMWVWHVPALYNAALADEGVHLLEHLSFLVTATIFWWPVIAPSEGSRLVPHAAIVYLFAANAASSLLGILLTFAQAGLYPAYLYPDDRLGIASLLRDGWGLSPAMDQQIGGLLMWVAGGLAFLCAIIGTLVRWYSLPEADLMASPR